VSTQESIVGPATAASRRRPRGGLSGTLRGIYIVWYRDLLRYWRDRVRAVVGLAQPLLFLVVFGAGLGSSLGGAFSGNAASGGLSYAQFVYPGVMGMAVLFSAMFGAMSIVWDREFGFLREMLVAPVSRTSIVLGKCLGGATVATLQALVLLALAGLVGVPYAPLMMIGCVLLLFVIAFSITAFGLVLAVRVQSIQTVMPRVQLLLTPLMFLSGAFFPVTSALPAWLHVLTLANPLTYGVDALRRLVPHYAAPAFGKATALHWGSWTVPVWLDVVIVAGTGAALLGVAAWMFSRPE